MKVLVTQSRLTLCDPVDCSPPGSSVHKILQARLLEWVAILFSRGSSWPRDWTQVACIAGKKILLSSEPPGKPTLTPSQYRPTEMHWIAPVLWKKKCALLCTQFAISKVNFWGEIELIILIIFQKKKQTGKDLAEADFDGSETKSTQADPVEGGRAPALQRWTKQVRAKGGQAPCFCLCWASRPLVLSHLHASLSGLSPAGWLLLLMPGSHPLVIVVWGRLYSVCPQTLALLLLDHSV